MINADNYDKTTGGSHELLSQLWLLPLLLLQAILEVFSGHAQKLKQSRKETDSQVPDWPRHVEDLRAAEWMMRWLIARNASRVMTGEPVDLTDLMAAVLRHVRRLDRQAHALAHPNAQPSSTSSDACARAQAAPTSPAFTPSWRLGIPAPP